MVFDVTLAKNRLSTLVARYGDTSYRMYARSLSLNSDKSTAYTGTCTAGGVNQTSLASDAGLVLEACQWVCAGGTYVHSQDVVRSVSTTNPDPVQDHCRMHRDQWAGTSGDVIGSFAASKLYDVNDTEILFGGTQAIVSDQNNYKVKLLDLQTEKVSTLSFRINATTK